jgi:hypothetical protein
MSCIHDFTKQGSSLLRISIPEDLNSLLMECHSDIFHSLSLNLALTKSPSKKDMTPFPFQLQVAYINRYSFDNITKTISSFSTSWK